jgi:GTP cyclohydrolase I
MYSPHDDHILGLAGHFTDPLGEAYMSMDVQHAKEFLQVATGETFESEHMQRTPERFLSMLQELTTPSEFDFTVFDNASNLDEMVSLYQIPFYTLCAHHVVPFFGYAHVGYVPGNSIAGLSKFSRAVQQLSKKLCRKT